MNDPWIYLSAFGLLASAALLVYLIRQLGAIEEPESPGHGEDPDEKAIPQEVLEQELQAAQAVADLMQRSVPPESSPEEMPAAEIPALEEPAAPAEPPAPEPAREPERSKPDLSPAVAYLKALNDDIRTFHGELQGIKARFEQFEQRQDKQWAEVVRHLERLDRPGERPSVSTEGLSEGEADM